MIDTHCHLEQHVYDSDRDEVIENCKHFLKAVITCGPDPEDYKLTFDMVQKHANFVFAIVGIHPEYAARFDDEQVENAMRTIVANRDKIVGIGETGLDYATLTDEASRQRQRQLFAKFIQLAENLAIPVVVHLRNGEDKEVNDVFNDAFEILEREKAKRVQLHMFGSRQLVQQAVDNGWYISMNAICLRSKSYSKVVRDTSLDRLLLETDAPWLHPSFDKDARNDPTHLKAVVERVAEIKKTSAEEIVAATTKNAIEFFSLKI